VQFKFNRLARFAAFEAVNAIVTSELFLRYFKFLVPTFENKTHTVTFTYDQYRMLYKMRKVTNPYSQLVIYL
jgi:hypothetical protein